MISIDILYDELSPSELDKAANWLRRVKPPFAAVFSGSRFEQAAGYAAMLHRDIFETSIILRNSGAKGGNPDIATDDGIHTRMSPQDWYTRHCLPLKDTGCIIACDNESARPDMNVYAAWLAVVMDLAGKDGIRLAVGKTATGNPAEHQYAQMDDLWYTLTKWQGLHVYSPHEYHGQTPQLSGGHINRYTLAWERCKQLGISIMPITVIGEYGYLRSNGGRLDPEWGFRRDRLSGKQAAEMDIGYHRDWYAVNGVTACAYAFCGTNTRWKDLNVNDDGWLDTIAAYNASLPKPTPPPPVITPPEPPPTGKITIPRAELAEMKRELDLSIAQTRRAIAAHEEAGNALQTGILSAEMLQERLNMLLGE